MNGSASFVLNFYLSWFMKWWTTFILIACFGNSSFSQEQNLDSLLEIAFYSNVDSIQSSAALDIARSKKISRDTVVVVLNRTLQLEKGADSMKYLPIVHVYLGEQYGEERNVLKCYFHYSMAAKLDSLAGDYNYAAQDYRIAGGKLKGFDAYDKSISILLKGLAICDQHDIVDERLKIYVLLGHNFIRLRDQNTALYYYQKVIRTDTSLYDGAWKEHAIAYTGIGNVYDQRKEYDSCIYFQKKAVKLYEVYQDPYISTNYLNIANSYASLKKFQPAETYYYKALSVKKKNGDEEGVSWTYLNFAHLKMDQSQLDSAQVFLNYSEALNSRSLKQRLSATKIQAEICKKQGEFEKAMMFFEQATELKDSIYFEDLAAGIRENEARYRTEKQAQEIALLEKDKKLEITAKEAEIAKRESVEAINKGKDLYLSLIAVIALGLLGFGIYTFIIYRRKKKVNQELNEQKNIIELKNSEIQDSLNYASKLQAAILPSLQELQDCFSDHFVLYQPKETVAGDFYWQFDSETHLYFAVADCTGHGVPGAMVSMVCSGALTRAVKEFNHSDPARILDQSRDLVIEAFNSQKGVYDSVSDGMDISLIALEKQTGKLIWAGANNPLWLINKEGTELREWKGDKQPIGRFQNQKPFTSNEIEYQKGDRIYLSSDGYADQFGGDLTGMGKKLKVKNFKRKLVEIQSQNLAAQKRELEGFIKKWMGDLEQLDDICVVGIEL